MGKKLEISIMKEAIINLMSTKIDHQEHLECKYIMLSNIIKKVVILNRLSKIQEEII